MASTGASWFGQVFRDKNCEITHLDISSNYPCDEGVRMFCNGFRRRNCELDLLDLSYCKLTHACMHDLSEVLKNQKCRLNNLSLRSNDIGDEGVDMLFDALKVKQIYSQFSVKYIYS